MDKKTYYVMTAIIAVLCVTIGCLIGANYLGKENKKPLSPEPSDTTQTIEPQQKDEDDKTSNTNINVIGVYQYNFKQDGQDRYYSISLYDNGTYTNGTDECGHMAGKYTVNNNVIEFEDVIYYECDACFHKKESIRFGDSFKKYTATINNNKITLNGSLRDYTYEKVSSNPGEAPTNLLNPVDDGEYFVDCTNLTSK